MHALTEQAIEQALTDIEAQHAGNRPVLLRHILTRMAQHAEQTGRSDALLSLRTTQQAGDDLGITAQAVRKAAQARGMGWNAGRDLILTADEVEQLRDRPAGWKPGRPRKAALDASS